MCVLVCEEEGRGINRAASFATTVAGNWSQGIKHLVVTLKQHHQRAVTDEESEINMLCG